MNRPLSKEASEKLKRFLEGPFRLVSELAEAEAFWREAVKNAPEFGHSSSGYRCNFCNAMYVSMEAGRHRIDHKPDCPWLLAQEG